MYANGWGVEPHNDTARRYFLKGVDLVRGLWYGWRTCMRAFTDDVRVMGCPIVHRCCRRIPRA